MGGKESEDDGGVHVVLAVDLDGTLLEGDSLWIAFLIFLKTRPWQLFLVPWWLLRGRAYLKERLARYGVEGVPVWKYNPSVLGMISAARNGGRRICLATAAHMSIAEAVARHLAVFDYVLASEKGINLKGDRKCNLLVSRFGERGFDYIGDSVADVPVWRHSRNAYLVCGGDSGRADDLRALVPHLQVLGNSNVACIPRAGKHKTKGVLPMKSEDVMTQSPGNASANSLWRRLFCVFAFFALSFAALLGFYGGTFYVATRAWFGVLVLVVLSWFGLSFLLGGAVGKSRAGRFAIVAGIITIGIALRIVTYDTFKTLPTSDFKTPHAAYEYQLEHNGFPADKPSFFKTYYSRFPSWYPYFRYIKLTYDTFGQSVNLVVFLNIFWYAFSAAFLYLAARVFWSFSTSALAASALTFSPFFVVWSSVTSPDHLSLATVCLMLFLFGKAYKARDSGNMGTTLCFSAAAMFMAAFTECFKPVALVYGLAFICVELVVRILPAVFSKNWAALFHRIDLALLAVAVPVFFISLSLVKIWMKTEVERDMHVPVVNSIWLYIGWGYSVKDGRYAPQIVDEKFKELTKEYPDRQDLVMEKMREYVISHIRQNIYSLPAVLREKAKTIFLFDTGAVTWAARETIKDQGKAVGKATGSLIGLPTFFTALLFFCSAIAAARQIWSKTANDFILLLLFMVVGYIMVLMLGGVQGRYKIIILPQLALLAAYGVHVMYSRLGEKLRQYAARHPKTETEQEKMEERQFE